jgi:hypothetical protein
MLKRVIEKVSDFFWGGLALLAVLAVGVMLFFSALPFFSGSAKQDVSEYKDMSDTNSDKQKYIAASGTTPNKTPHHAIGLTSGTTVATVAAAGFKVWVVDKTEA